MLSRTWGLDADLPPGPRALSRRRMAPRTKPVSMGPLGRPPVPYCGGRWHCRPPEARENGTLAMVYESASEIWRHAWQSVASGGHRRQSGSKGGSRELLHATFTLADPRRRWTLSRSPGINPAFALAEVIWIVLGRDDAAFLTPWNRSLSQFSGDDPILHGAYGHRLRRSFGVDQLARASEVLSRAPHHRQVVLQIWSADGDLPSASGKPQSDDIPCNVCSLLKISDGRLHWMQVMRSNDVVLGLPYNLVQWTSLQEITAGWIGVEVGNYTHVVDSLHIYDRDFDRFSIAEAPTDRSRNPVDLRQPMAQSRSTFALLEDTFEALANSESTREVEKAALGAARLGPYADWVTVGAAERLRRLGSLAEADDKARQVADSELRLSVLRWHERFRRDAK